MDLALAGLVPIASLLAAIVSSTRYARQRFRIHGIIPTISIGMRDDAEHKARTRRRIVKNAGWQSRVKGSNEPGVADLMKASGLSMGGFYKHFQIRKHLVAEAIEQGLGDFGAKVMEATAHVPAEQRSKEIVKFYLSSGRRLAIVSSTVIEAANCWLLAISY